MAENGLYRRYEHPCGVGLVVQSMESQAGGCRKWYRGAEAVGTVVLWMDGKTGDGAGIHVQIPVLFFYDQVRRTGHEPRGELIAVGQVFLPRTDFGV